MAMKRFGFILMLTTLSLRHFCWAEEPAMEMLANSGFEGPYREVSIASEPVTRITGRIADAWNDNSSWARVVVHYDEVTDGVHGGSSAQRITVRRIATGAVQLTQSPVDLQDSVAYRAQVFARSPDGESLTLQIRQPGAPYTSYAERRFQPGPDWASFELTFTSRVSGPALFMLLPGDAGTVDVDDASLKPASASEAPPREGNLLATGRMVGALANGWAPSDAPPEAFRYLPPSAREPYPQVVINGGAGGHVSLYSPPVVVNGGRLHTLGLDLRSDPPGAQVWLTVYDAEHDEAGIQKAVAVTAEWQRCVLRGELPFVQASAFAIRICLLTDARLHVRNVQLVEGQGPVEFEAAVPVELAIVPADPNGLVFDGQDAELRVEAAGPIPDGATLELSAHDIYGGVTNLPSLAVSRGIAASLQVRVRPPAERPRGMFRIEGQLIDGSGQTISNVAQALVARVPRPRQPGRLMPESPFGVHIPLDASYTRLAQNLGFKWCRIHDASMITKWPAAEPEPGQFRFYDEEVKLARSRGLMVLGMLDGAPPWASEVPKDFENDYFRRYFVPRDVNEWRHYVRTVVSHYRGLIDYWEVWNEPWASGFFRKVEDGQVVQGTPNDYVPLLKAAYEEAKAANPHATVLGIDSIPPEWTEACLKAGAAGSMDAFSFHQYTRRLAGGQFGPLTELVGQHRSLLADYGLADFPVWDTEGGPDVKEDTFYRGLDPLATSDGSREAAWHARYYLTTMALGIRSFFLYTLHSYPRLGQYTWVRIEPAGYLKPWAVAQANLAHLVQGMRFSRRIETEGGLVCLLFDGDGRKVAALFTVGGQPVTVASLKGLPAIDLYGNPTTLGQVTYQPVYAVDDNVSKVTAALR